MSTFLQFLFGGLVAGAIYALVALGWVLIYNVSKILNFAQGEFVMLGPLVFVRLAIEHDQPLWIAITAAVAITTAVGVLLDLVVLRRLPVGQTLPMILATLGASVVLREVAQNVFGKDPVRHPPLITGEPIEVGGATILPHTLLLWGSVAALVVLLTAFFGRTLVGKAMRACSDNAVGARIVGISPGRMRTAAFGISAALGAVAGILLVPLTAMSWDGGTSIGLKGFVAAVFGGMGSYTGAVVGGVVLGTLEALGAGYVSSAYKDVMALTLLVVLLLLRPEGLLGRRSLDDRVASRPLLRRRRRPPLPALTEL